jgi:hypothetical protein
VEGMSEIEMNIIKEEDLGYPTRKTESTPYEICMVFPRNTNDLSISILSHDPTFLWR